MSTYNFLLWQNAKKLLQGVLVGSSLGLSHEKIYMEKGDILSLVEQNQSSERLSMRNGESKISG